MEIDTQHTAIFLGGATGIWKGIGVGLVLQSSPFVVGTCTALGAIFSVVVLYFAGEPVRNYVVRTLGKKRLDRKKGTFQLWLQKYGEAGLGLLATGPLGPFVPLLLGFMLLTETRRFFLFLLAGIVIWSYALAYFASGLIDVFTLISTP